MGQVVPFIARLRDSGDWTAAERARLQELADRLGDSGVHVEVIFGATDEGDPWCVVTDESGDVLIHVARIDGKFVVHSAADDAVNESSDLHAALRDSLVATEEAAMPRSATILPFGLSARQGQTFLALLAATTFFYETASIGDAAEAAEPAHLAPSEDPQPPPPADTDAPTQDRETAAQGVALQPGAAANTTTLAAASGPVAQVAVKTTEDPAPAAPANHVEELHVQAAAAPIEAPRTPVADAEPRILIKGTAGDDLLVGTSADEHIVGGDGNDTLRGGGGHDLLEGGAGDDVIEVTSQSVAIGGTGADTFLLQHPIQMGKPETLLGTILDFSRLEGDRIFNWNGEAVRLLQHPAPDGGDNGKAAPPTTVHTDNEFSVTTGASTDRAGGGDTGGHNNGFSPSTAAPGDPTLINGTRPPLVRVDVDLDGDGQIDGYILMGPRGVLELPINAGTGASFSHADTFN